MRLPLLFLFILSLFCLSGPPAQAQSDDAAALYEVTDVAADVTADSAAHARDQAVAQAQRTALQQLLTRLGANAQLAGKLGDDDIATLVQNFEVQNERSSSVRYIGTFTVQFRPGATRNWLNDAGASFTETRSAPVVVLPIYAGDGHPVLWEERTKWRAVWEGARNAGTVPLVVPAGDLDDIAIIGVKEAMQGDINAIRAVVAKYHAGGAVVAVLGGSLDTPGIPFTIDATHYDADGDADQPVHLNLPAATTKANIDAALADGMKQVRGLLENDARQSAETAKEPPMRLPVVVSTVTLADWTQIKNKLDAVPMIEHVNTVAVARGTTNIELVFRADVGELEDALSKQGLALSEDETTGLWILQMAAP